MTILIPMYLAVLLIMNLISLYHLWQYRGMKRYARGIQIGGVCFLIFMALMILPLVVFLSNSSV